MQYRPRDGRLVSAAVSGREGLEVLYYELWYDQRCFHRLAEEMQRVGVRSADMRALLVLAEQPLADHLRNTGIIWALGPLRTTGIAAVVSTVVSGLYTDGCAMGEIVQAGVSLHSIDQCYARYSFLVEQIQPTTQGR